MDRNKNNREEPEKVAPGMDHELNRDATDAEKRRGDTTKVTSLSWDEVDSE